MPKEAAESSGTRKGVGLQLGMSKRSKSAREAGNRLRSVGSSELTVSGDSWMHLVSLLTRFCL